MVKTGATNNADWTATKDCWLCASAMCLTTVKIDGITVAYMANWYGVFPIPIMKGQVVKIGIKSGAENSITFYGMK